MRIFHFKRKILISSLYIYYIIIYLNSEGIEKAWEKDS